MTDTNGFSDGFLWGAATSAHQIEGAVLEDGAGASTWHRFAHSPGNTAFGETGDVACDHYHRYAEDVAIMASLGLQSYRFSISWSRVLPAGRGAVNARGLDFYDRLVDALLAREIRPNATLYHWDLPAALDDLGGWLNRDVAAWFADYTTLLVRRLGDRVPLWSTLNEPWVSMDAGYLHGVHAPGHRNVFEAPIAAHNLLLAHGAAVQAFRAEQPAGARIGVVVNLEPKDAATDTEADRAAAARADAYMNRFFLDAMLRGAYPDELRDVFGAAWPVHGPDDFALIGAPLDFVGINWYKRGVVRDDPDAPPVRVSYVRQPQHPHTTMGLDWEVHPPSLTRTLTWFRDRYGDVPVYITENGAAFYDPPSPIDGRVEDPLRVAYIRAHLRAVRDAIRAGVDVRGYYVWSLLDNYEWSAGYGHRFGIVHVDFATLTRTPKSSAHFYADVIRTHGAALAGAAAHDGAQAGSGT
jgi:beta-glucosidase